MARSLGTGRSTYKENRERRSVDVEHVGHHGVVMIIIHGSHEVIGLYDVT